MEKKNTGLIVGIIILLIALMASCGYIVYDKFFETSDTSNKDIYEEPSTSNIDANSILQSLGKYLFAKTNYCDVESCPFYEGDLVTYDKIGSSEAMAIAYQNITGKNILYYDDNCLYQYEALSCPIEMVTKGTFEASFKNVFGSDKAVSYSNLTYGDLFYLSSTRYCKLNKNSYYFNTEVIECFYSNGGSGYSSAPYIQYDYAKMDNDDIIIYVNYLKYYTGYAGIYGTDPSALYSDSDLTKKIADLDSSTSLTVDEMFEKYAGKTGVYKVTFKKDSTGNYYWYSSEKEK